MKYEQKYILCHEEASPGYQPINHVLDFLCQTTEYKFKSLSVIDLNRDGGYYNNTKGG